MKTKVLGLITLFVMGAFTVFAGNKTEKFKVYGNCGMCESRIENAAKSLEGVSSAEWNKDTKILEVNYDDQKASGEQIQTSVAMAGHDTQLFSANDKKYAELPGCCQYLRDENRKPMNHEMKQECNHESTMAPGSCCGTPSCDK